MATYKIKSGDTLAEIARRFGTSVRELARLNDISNPDRIYAGNTLQLPGGSGDGDDGGGLSDEDKEARLQYGFSSEFLEKNDEIRKLIDNAIDNEWTQNRFLDEMRQTDWWRKRSDSEKEFEILKVENPEELQSQLDTARSSVRNLSVRLGVYLNGDQIRSVARSWVRNGLSEDEVRDMVGRKYSYGDSNKRRGGNVGVAGAARAHLDELGRSYGLKWGGGFLTGAARQVARGRRTVSDYEAMARQQAQETYSSVAADIKEGRTVRDILEPYMQVAAEELGIPANTMNTTHTKWIAPISGEKRLSMDEWTAELRKNDRYGYNQTNKGRREAARFAQQMMATLGAR